MYIQTDEESESECTFLYLLLCSTSSSNTSSISPLSILAIFLMMSFYKAHKLLIFSNVVKFPSIISSWVKNEVYEFTWYLGNFIYATSVGLIPN